jgi:hypothetical protein
MMHDEDVVSSLMRLFYLGRLWKTTGILLADVESIAIISIYILSRFGEANVNTKPWLAVVDVKWVDMLVQGVNTSCSV